MGLFTERDEYDDFKVKQSNTMHNKIKALLYTILIIAGTAAFLTACFWYPMFILNALVFTCGAWATYLLYIGLVAHFEYKDKNK